MLINSLIIDFELPFAFSIKDRRKVINSIKGKLSKFNISILDISSQYPKEASIAIAYLSHNTTQSFQIKESIEKELHRYFPEIEFFTELEII